MFWCRTVCLFPAWLACFVSFACFDTGHLAWGIESSWKVGVAKADITPTEPLRLAGYSARSAPFESVADPLHLRALVLESIEGDSTKSEQGVSVGTPTEPRIQVILSLDATGISALTTDQIVAQLTKRLSLQRSQVVISTTHSHTAPMMSHVLTNLLALPLSDQETAAMNRYTDWIVEQAVTTVERAYANRKSAKLEYGSAASNFAVNRRVLQDGKWKGFGIQTDGATDHRVQVLRIRDQTDQVTAIVYQYACHCTTLGPEFNRVSADWAGLSAANIESVHSNCIAFPIIGCGADANPNPRGDYQHAKAHAEQLSSAVIECCSRDMHALPAISKSVFEYVALAPEIPTRESLKGLLESSSPHERRFAELMLSTWQRKGRLPETYPAPLHLIQFGKDLTWVWMGGEVVVDYQMRFEKELSDSKHVWVAGYTDDVFAYVASERMRIEAGYEVDASMIYYSQPGRWKSGTEEAIVARVLAMAKLERSPEVPRSPSASLASMLTAPGWNVELVASEPMIKDPINVAFDAQGRAWVVEMGDYPLGGPMSGCIKILEDQNHDGIMDSSIIFLDGLDFPSGVYPWRDGAIVACAPDIFFAADRDGDGKAEYRKTIVTGFAKENQQHRVNGITYGLDHRLYFGIGGATREVTVAATGETIKLSGSDLSIDPDHGDVRRELGKTQFIRGRDDWGNWFGNENSYPLFHYVIEDRYRGSSQSKNKSMVQHAFNPPAAPPVFPISRSLDRFNDLFAANRYTSACSGILHRHTTGNKKLDQTAFVCEPVHNLVARIQLVPQGPTWVGSRYPDDNQSEWLRSDDPWFRPVRIENASDGTLWVVDMYRRVIEHPEWIPDEWQKRIDVRSGDQQGRIYRVYHSPEKNVKQKHRLASMEAKTIDQLVEDLGHSSGSVRDLAQQQLVWRNDASTIEKLRSQLSTAEHPIKRLTAFAALSAMKAAKEDDLKKLLRDSDLRVVRMAIQWTEEIPGDYIQDFNRIATDQARYSPPVGLQLLLTLSLTPIKDSDIMAKLLAQNASDPWFLKASELLSQESVDAVLQKWLAENESSSPEMQNMLMAILPKASEATLTQSVRWLSQSIARRPTWHFVLGRAITRSNSLPIQLEAPTRQSMIQEAWKCLESPNDDLARTRVAIDYLTAEWQTNVDAFGDKRLTQRLTDFVLHGQEESIEATAIQALLSVDINNANPLLATLAQFTSSNQATIMQRLMSQPDGLPVLASSLEQAVLKPQDISTSVQNELRNRTEVEWRDKFVKLLGPTPGADRQAIVASYLQRWPVRSDAVAGEPLFVKHCGLCHQDRKEAKPIAPSLADMRSLTNPAWLTAIFDPHRTVEEKYRRWNVLTQTGQVLTGILSSENDQTVVLITSDAKPLEIQRSNIEKMEPSSLSLMPEGFEQQLTPQQIGDLVAYLRSR